MKNLINWLIRKKIEFWVRKIREDNAESIQTKLTREVEKLPLEKKAKRNLENLKGVFLSPKGLAYLRRIVEGINPLAKRKFLNFLLRISAMRMPGFYQYQKKYHHDPLFTILISPTMRCNLKCEGCYANKYKREDDLPVKFFEKIITQGKKMGVILYTILGGEPFLLWPELQQIIKKHQDVYFQIFTNGTIINEEIAEDLEKLGNAVVEFSLEGFIDATNSRRQKGVFEKVMTAMDILKKHGVPFGCSCCVTSRNVKEVMSDEFLDLLLKKGALVVWYFLYMPVGGAAEPKLMPTPEQREWMKNRGAEIRKTKAIFIIDFWNDAPYVRGCIAGRLFIHINSNGDIEPCIFFHFATHNIKKTSLEEALESEFFKDLRSRQPYSENLYTPCTIIDHPEVLDDLLKKHKPYPTHEGAEDVINKFFPCLTLYSQKVKEIYQRHWGKEVEEKFRKIHGK